MAGIFGNIDFSGMSDQQLMDFGDTTRIAAQNAQDAFGNAGAGNVMGSGGFLTGGGIGTPEAGGMGGGIFGDLGGIGGMLGLAGNLGNLYMMFKSLNMAEDMFDFQKGFAEKQYAANKAAYENKMDSIIAARQSADPQSRAHFQSTGGDTYKKMPS